MVLRLMSCPPRRPGFFATVIRGLKVCLNPVGPTCLRELDTSVGVPGQHDFAVRSHPSQPKASTGKAPFVSTPLVRSQASRPALRLPCVPDAAASTASRPAFVTTRDRPSYRNETAEVLVLICPTAEAIYFFKGDWTGRNSLNWFRKLDFTRKRFGVPRSPDKSRMSRHSYYSVG